MRNLRIESCFRFCNHIPRGPVAQWLEQSTHNALVLGSSPGRPTNLHSVTLLVSANGRKRVLEWKGRAEHVPRRTKVGQSACFQFSIGRFRANFVVEFNDCSFGNSLTEFLLEGLPVIQFLAEHFSAHCLGRRLKEFFGRND